MEDQLKRFDQATLSHVEVADFPRKTTNNTRETLFDLVRRARKNSEGSPGED